MRYHYLAQYLADTQHRIAIVVIGAGGTGSHVLTNLATINYAFIKLGKAPFVVTTYDPDIVEEHNVGRQMFSPADIGLNKATVLTERINRFFGTDWEAKPYLFAKHMDSNNTSDCNIIITCVDTAKSRRDISSYIKLARDNDNYRASSLRSVYYWMDIGNSLQSGQVLLGTIQKIKQPDGVEKSLDSLPCWTEEFKGVRDKKEEPSCSLAESLGRQDLFINKMMATYATTMLWQFFKYYRIHYRGIYINLEMMKTQPILL